MAEAGRPGTRLQKQALMSFEELDNIPTMTAEQVVRPKRDRSAAQVPIDQIFDQNFDLSVAMGGASPQNPFKYEAPYITPTLYHDTPSGSHHDWKARSDLKKI